MTARQPKYTKPVVARITLALSMGATLALAAKYGGVSTETIRLWRQKHAAFAAAVDLAQGTAAVGWLGKIEKAASEGTWQAAAWKLERLYPQEYGRTVHEHQGTDGGPIQSAATLVVKQEPYDLDAIDAHIRRISGLHPALPGPDGTE